MSSLDVERKRKLNDDFDNIFREHQRLQQDLNKDNDQQYKSVLQSIDKWEQEAINKIHKAAKTARNDAKRLLKTTNERLQLALYDSVTEKLQETLQKNSEYTENDIDQWLVNLSEIRKQLEATATTIEFAHDEVINLIKLKQIMSSGVIQRLNLNYREFHFEKLHGNPVFHKVPHLISTNSRAAVISRNTYRTGSHSFRFRVEIPTEKIFFGIIKDKNNPETSYGWWNIDRCVIHGRKQPYVSTLRMMPGDEIILTLNCDAHEIFLEYPSMRKLNPIKLTDETYRCPPPWHILIEIGTPGQCIIKLIDWGKTATK